MTARSFLLRGLLAGLVAGLLGFAVAYAVGEPSIEAAIALEESAADDGHTHTHSDDHTHGAGEDAGPVSRGTQRTWGLATGTVAIGVALGGLVALAAAAVMGRIGRLRPSQSTALVAAVGFVAVALVPFLKYPAAPPAVGSGDTIGERTGYYFTFLLVSVVVAALAVALGNRLLATHGAYVAVVAGCAAYVVAMSLAAALMPSVNEVGTFPADTLWSFRLGSLATLTALWAGIGVVLVGLVGREWQRTEAVAARRALAASL